MIKEDYTVRFITPAFLGNAEQRGKWRTPPFKALLRQWWRVVTAKEYGYRWQEVRQQEGKLFGNVFDDKSAAQSAIKLRLAHWETGKLTRWPGDTKVTHPEVARARCQVGAHIYLGYGPLSFDKAKGETVFTHKEQQQRTAIDAGAENTLSLLFAERHRDTLHETLRLIHAFGTLGGRCRNGWGSLTLQGEAISPAPIDYGALARRYSQELSTILAQPLEWPHAFGVSQQRLLVWQTAASYATWSQAMTELAKIKIDFRTKPPIMKLSGPPGAAEPRHTLAYPVTNHDVNAWRKENFRLANQLRFKVLMDQDNRYRGLAFHLPTATPEPLLNALGRDRAVFENNQDKVWAAVHDQLNQQMQPVEGGQL